MISERIRLAYFSNSTVRGGVEEHILTLLHGLNRELFQPHLICPPDLVEKLGSDVPSDVIVLALQYSSPVHLRAAYRLSKFLKQHQIQILHSHLFRASLFASPIGRISGVPLVIETPHLRESWRDGWFKGSFVVDRCVGRFVDHYIAVSDANAKYLQGTKKLPRNKIRTIHNGSDVDRFHPSHPAPIELKTALGFAMEDPMILVPARLEPQKGHEVLLKALAQVVVKFPQVRVVCAGEGALRNSLEEQTQTLGLERNVRFIGRTSKLEDWLALCDFSVLPSLFEGFPLVAVESLASGRPMVATAVDGTPEVILNGKTGLTVPPSDPIRLADAICKMLGDQELRSAMAVAGRNWVLNNFTQRQQLELTQDFYIRNLARVCGWESKGNTGATCGNEHIAEPTAIERAQ
jgi:glycosyltransferase involved in cell wall biosynthesis